ncbi:MAG: hypothetical protein H0X45_03075 [Planctomycetes bacterium]|nr:hypothetical protein [Planctomycetota bacterium]
MALHIIIEAGVGEERRWRAEVDPDDGWTRLFDGAQVIASAWFCPPKEWESIEPDAPVVHAAFERVAATLERLDFNPTRPNADCESDDNCATG